MKIGKGAAVNGNGKVRKKREIGGEGSKSFTAQVTFIGFRNGERFKDVHEVQVKASTLIGATGRAAREGFIVAKEQRPGKCKWLEVGVTINPD